MFIQFIYAHVSQPETWLRGRQQAIRGHLNHWMQLSTSEGQVLLFAEPQQARWGVVVKDALGQVGLWMAQFPHSPFSAQSIQHPLVRGFCLHLFCYFPAAGELITALFQDWLLMTEVSTEQAFKSFH